MNPISEPESEKASPHLVRQIGLGSGVAVVVGSTIGSGIFKSPSGIAEQMPGPLPMLLVWVVGGFFVLCGALTLSEVGSAYPFSGGMYVYIREAYGRLAAFLFGWAQLVLIRPAAVGAVAVVFSQYALRFAGIEAGQAGFESKSALVAIGAIAAVTIANTVGVKFGTGIQNLTTLAKTAGLLVLIAIAFVIGAPQAGAHFSPAVPPGSFSISMFGLALVSVLWAYDGWADGCYVGGEMTNPRRNLPRATLLGTVVVIAIYLLANLAYLAVFSVDEMAKSEVIAADAMNRLVGVGGATFIIATVMISTFGTLNGSLLTSPRIFFAMAEDRLLFKPLARVHPKFNTPYVSVILSGALGISYVVAATAASGSKAFSSLTDAFVISLVPFYALGVGSVFVFRRRQKERAKQEPVADIGLADSLIDSIDSEPLETHPHEYRPTAFTPLFPILPILFVLSTAFLLVNSLIGEESRIPTLITLGIVAMGAPLYFTTIGRRRPATLD